MTKKWIKRFLISDAVVLLLLVAPLVFAITATEAPTGFDDKTNGFTTQAQFDLDKAIFD